MGGSREEALKHMEELHREEAVVWFQQDWQVYQHVLQGDHLEHQLVYDGVLKLLMQQRQALGRRLRLLDLGCGDAEYISRTLRQLAQQQQEPLLESYVGVDLSRPALALARQHLSSALSSAAHIELHLEDMLSYLRKQVAAPGHQQFDIILSSFALHHLTTDEKLQALTLAKQLLVSGDGNVGGAFALVDVIRQPEETLDDYLARFAADVDATWSKLDSAGKATVKSHVLQFDKPESVPVYQQLCKQAGFPGKTQVLAEGSKSFSKLVVFLA